MRRLFDIVIGHMNLSVHIDKVDCHVHTHGHHPHAPIMHLLTLGPVTEQQLNGPETKPMEVVVLTDSQQADVAYGPPLDKKGKPAQVQAGSIVWVSTDGNVATVTPDPADPTNSLKGTIVAGVAGVCEVFPTADADLGDGVKTIEGVHIPIQVTGGEATGFGDPTVGTVVEQP